MSVGIGLKTQEANQIIVVQRGTVKSGTENIVQLCHLSIGNLTCLYPQVNLKNYTRVLVGTTTMFYCHSTTEIAALLWFVLYPTSLFLTLIQILKAYQ